MRAKEMGVPRLAGLGSYVYYTHRATGVVGGHTFKDVRGRADRRAMYQALGLTNENGAFSGKQLPVPLRRKRLWAGGYMPPVRMTRWVAVWPSCGYGTVTGLTYRAEGVYNEGGAGLPSWDGPGEPEPPYLEQWNRWPLYEVRTSLTGMRMLVPVWACVPVPREMMVLYGLEESEAPTLLGDDDWAMWCDRWFTPGRRRAAAAV